MLFSVGDVTYVDNPIMIEVLTTVANILVDNTKKSIMMVF